MGATLVMVVTLAIVLDLILVLLAELYCSLLLRCRQHKTNSYSNTVADSAAAAAAAPHLPSTQQSQDHPTGPSFGSFLGILRTPKTSFPHRLLPKKKTVQVQRSSTQFLQVFDIPVQNQEMLPNTSPCHIGIIMSIPSPSISFVTSRNQPQMTKLVPVTVLIVKKKLVAAAAVAVVELQSILCTFPTTKRSAGQAEQTLLSKRRTCRHQGWKWGVLLLQAPGTKRLRNQPPQVSNPITTSPLTPMKKLPAEDCSLSLRDARSLGTSGSDSKSDNGLSSSSSGSPSTSPSW